LGGASPPPQLQERNYIYFYFEPHAPGSGFGTGLAQLVTALQTDLAWIREHTRLLARATEWEIGGRPANRLLSGSDIADAKDWAARRPKDAPPPTNLHLDYIKVSEEQETARSSAQRQQLEMVALAQEERAKALAAAEEAVARAADLQVKRARLRNFALIAMTAAAVLVGWLYLRADAQRHVAEEQTALAKEHKALAEKRKASADAMLNTTTSLIVEMSQKFTFNSADYEKVRLVFERGVEEGDATSMGNLGLIYRNGWGVDRDYLKARDLFEKGAALNNANVMYSIGALYADGLGVAQDYGKAREWYEKSAAGDNIFAMEKLGVIYTQALGVTQDYGKAREWYEKAAALGSTPAMSDIATFYAEGHGVTQDYAKAREWLQKAVAKGSASAMNSPAAAMVR
jgi:TPR repeat protein